jgi:hypothetical protein
MKRHLVSVAFAAAFFWSAAPAVNAQTGQETNKAFRQAFDAANQRDLNAPRLAQVLQDAEGEEEEQDAALPPKRKQTLKATPPTLPDWTPPVPQFKPDGPVSKKNVGGEERIAQTGTSPLAPAELGNSWETAKTAEFMRSRNNLTVNGKIIVKVTLTDYYEPKEEVHLEAVRGPKEKITHVTIYSPLPKATGSGK